MAFTCEICGYEAKTRAGLAGHARLAHDKPTSVEGRKVDFQEALDAASGVLEDRVKALESHFQKHLEPLKEDLEAVKHSLEKPRKVDVHGFLKHIADCPDCYGAFDGLVRKNEGLRGLNEKLSKLDEAIEPKVTAILVQKSKIKDKCPECWSPMKRRGGLLYSMTCPECGFERR